MNTESKLSGPFSAIVCAAGSSTRMGGNVRKPYLSLRGKPILSWTLAALARIPQVQQIVLVTRPDDRDMALDAAAQADLPQRVTVDTADGGARRQDSVFNGLKATRTDAQLVLIHDAARPFPQHKALVEVCAKAAEIGAAILACRVRDTIKRERPGSSAVIDTTVPRAGLWQAQTPQVFQRQLILDCFEKLAREAPELDVTDDASICEFFQQPVALVESSTSNFKVTQPEDIAIAEAFLSCGLVE
jgi:2-C-methyl-D-erythritol 4-phosphate cytidylyltransferase